MYEGNAGLAKRRANSDSGALDTPLDAEVIPWEPVPNRQKNLRVVEVERRAADRFDAAIFGPIVPSKSTYRFCKRAVDIAGASLAILALSPVILAIAAYSYRAGGSPLFRHRRVGKDGVVFDCLKFRTMVKNADVILQELLRSDPKVQEEWLKHHKLRDDPRVTKFGRFLRRSSLDELPQLWNVLRGDMSLVGPRPVVADELLRYGDKAKTYMSVAPGVTGLWQVSGRNDMTFRRRIAMDVYYVRSRRFTLDLYILCRTLPAVFATNGAY